MRYHLIEYVREHRQQIEQEVNHVLKCRNCTLDSFLDKMYDCKTCGYKATLLIMSKMFNTCVMVVRSDYVWLSREISPYKCPIVIVQDGDGQFLGTKTNTGWYVGLVPKIHIPIAESSDEGIKHSTPLKRDHQGRPVTIFEAPVSPIDPERKSTIDLQVVMNQTANQDPSSEASSSNDSSIEQARADVQKFEEQNLSTTTDPNGTKTTEVNSVDDAPTEVISAEDTEDAQRTDMFSSKDPTDLDQTLVFSSKDPTDLDETLAKISPLNSVADSSLTTGVVKVSKYSNRKEQDEADEDNSSILIPAAETPTRDINSEIPTLKQMATEVSAKKKDMSQTNTQLNSENEVASVDDSEELKSSDIAQDGNRIKSKKPDTSIGESVDKVPNSANLAEIVENFEVIGSSQKVQKKLLGMCGPAFSRKKVTVNIKDISKELKFSDTDVSFDVAEEDDSEVILKYGCRKCSSMFFTIPGYQRHLFKEHRIRRVEKYQPEVISQKVRKLKPVLTSENEDEEKAKKDAKMAELMKQAYGTKEEPELACDECDSMFFLAKSLETHKENAHKEKNMDEDIPEDIIDNPMKKTDEELPDIKPPRSRLSRKRTLTEPIKEYETRHRSKNSAQRIASSDKSTNNKSETLQKEIPQKKTKRTATEIENSQHETSKEEQESKRFSPRLKEKEKSKVKLSTLRRSARILDTSASSNYYEKSEESSVSEYSDEEGPKIKDVKSKNINKSTKVSVEDTSIKEKKKLIMTRSQLRSIEVEKEKNIEDKSKSKSKGHKEKDRIKKSDEKIETEKMKDKVTNASKKSDKTVVEEVSPDAEEADIFVEVKSKNSVTGKKNKKKKEFART